MGIYIFVGAAKPRTSTVCVCGIWILLISIFHMVGWMIYDNEMIIQFSYSTGESVLYRSL